MDNTHILQEALTLPNTQLSHLKALRAIVHTHVPHDVEFLAQQALLPIIQEYNDLVRAQGLGESCVVKPTDTTKTIRKRCKKAFRHGLKHYPMRYIYAVSGSPMASGLGEEYNPYDSPDTNIKTFTGQFKKDTRKIKKPLTLKLVDPESGLQRDDEPFEMVEGETSTERVRKYYKRHPDKVRKYLRDTVKDRVARNRDRRKAVKTHGKVKMKNYDVHHPNGAQNGNWKLAKKDHGRDKVNEEYTPEQLQQQIEQFVTYASQQLKLNQVPSISIQSPSSNMTSLGGYNPVTKHIIVVTDGRLLADILRTVAHEMAHCKQDELGYIRDIQHDGATGSPVENNANTIAGILLRQYGKQHRHIFLLEHVLKNTVLCAKCLWRWKLTSAGKDKYICHKCWHDNTPQYLTEGGAHGHLAHPFEDTDLTFDDFDSMLERALVGNLQEEGPVIEKMDGQNIAFTVRDGKVVFARNKGHVKNRGENALSAEELAQKFADRGEISDAFALAARDIEEAISKLPPEEVERVFGNGRHMMSTEIIYPGTQNTIPYDKTILVFHGTLEHDDEGNKVGTQNTENGKILSDAVVRVNAQQQRTFGISGPRTVAISDQVTDELKSAYTRLSAQMEGIREQYGLKPTATLRDYLDRWWSDRLSQIEEQQGFKFTNAEREGLISRWVDGDKKFGVKNLSDEKKGWFREYEKTELKKDLGQSTKPFQQVFLNAGVYALKRVVEFLSANNPEMAAKLKQEFADTVRAIQETGGPAKLDKLQYELARLKELGVDNVVPTEGLIFTYNGNPYKLTGTFAPLNQIMGVLKYDRAPDAPEEPKTTDTQPKEPISEPEPKEPPTQPAEQPTQPRAPVAIYPGRFHPFHAGHNVTYQAMVEQFGKDNVYIVMSGKQDSVSSPFSFEERRTIMARMFGIPEDHIIEVKSPYNPVELTGTLPEGTPVVFGVGEKDAERLGGGKYFRPYDPDQEMADYKVNGYVWIAPPPNLEVNGKEISGTELRAVMGDPQFTERAKKEIFTKVYGKFDQEIFDKIVKVATESEEARQLTAQYGGKKPVTKGEKKPSTQEPSTEPIPAPSSGAPTDVASSDRDAALAVLSQKILNRETGRKIFVATALKYPEDAPVRREAEQLLQQAIASARSKRQQPTQEIITEAVNPDKLKVYLHVRDFTDEELAEEVEEYFDNEKTFRAFPDLAEDREQLINMIKDADEEVLTTDELLELTNSDVGGILTSDNPKQLLVKIAKENQKDLPRLKKALAGKQDLPMPIVIKHSEGYYLMAGNTRLSLLAAKGYTIPVKVLVYDKPVLLAPVTAPPEKPAARQSKAKEVFKKLLKMRVRNPETNNYIKIDTAMDYNKQHPAHKLAMNTIRQHMRGLSNRAGVPKNRRD